MDRHGDIHGDVIIFYGIEENVWQSIEDLFMENPAVRELVHRNKANVIGVIYDVASGPGRVASGATIRRDP